MRQISTIIIPIKIERVIAGLLIKYLSGSILSSSELPVIIARRELIRTPVSVISIMKTLPHVTASNILIGSISIPSIVIMNLCVKNLFFLLLLPFFVSIIMLSPFAVCFFLLFSLCVLTL